MLENDKIFLEFSESYLYKIESTKDIMNQKLTLIGSSCNTTEMTNLICLKNCYSYLYTKSQICEVFGVIGYEQRLEKALNRKIRNIVTYIPLKIRGKIYPFKVKVIKDFANNQTFILFEKDIGLGMETYENLLKNTYKDALTNLFNRNTYEFHVSKAVGIHYLGYFDIDSFKKFNDKYSHDTGNDVLKAVGKLLVKISNNHIIFYRCGGDEFLFYTVDLNYEETYKYCEKILKTMGSLGVCNDKITCSLGFVRYDSNGKKTAKECKILSDLAMYISKAKGGNTITYLDEQKIEEIKKEGKFNEVFKSIDRKYANHLIKFFA